MPPSIPLRPRCLPTHISIPVSTQRRHVITLRTTGIPITTAAATRIEQHRLRNPPSRAVGTATMPPAPTAKPVKGQRVLPALFVRSGTSNGLVLRASDLPPNENGAEAWRDILPAAMGSPDPVHARQLDGMGGGISSTSKVCVLAPSRRDDADVDFTFVQVGIRDGGLDLAGNCGNMSAVVGPVAWDWGFVKEGKGGREGRVRSVKMVEGKEGEEYREALVRIFNTNTSKILHARFRVAGNPPVYCPAGTYTMDGVPGKQSCITLSFVDPAGAKTGKALPTGNPVDILALPDGSEVRASLVDVSNPGVFVALEDLGLGHLGPEALTPATVEADAELKERLENIRRAGAARMGLNPDVQSVPKIVLLFPRETESAEGKNDAGVAGVDVRCLAMSMGQAHKAVPLTLALCLGAAANIEGTVAAEVRTKSKRSGNDETSSSSVVIGHPSGTVEIGATFKDGKIVSADLHRTARILMKGEVYY